MARALDKGPFVRGLRKYTLPILGATSIAWVGYEALNAPQQDKLKRATQVGLGALGTFIGARYGFKHILNPDPHTAGAIGKLALEHLQVLLKKVDLDKLKFKSEDLLEESLHNLKLGHLFDEVKDPKKTTLDDVLEELETPEEVFQVLDHLGLKLGKFKDTLQDTMKRAQDAGGEGLKETDLQTFRIQLLKHVFDEHNVQFPKSLDDKLKLTTDESIRYGNAKAIRQELEELLDKFTDWKDDIGLDNMATFKNKKGNLDPKGFVTHRLQRAKDLLNTIIPGPGNISSKEMMGEIKDLTWMGILPVAGGVAGGTLGDAVTGEDWSHTIKDKSKEGLFQFLANIMLCNVGAMAFLGATELTANSKRLPKAVTEWAGEYGTRFGAMVAGILSVGVIGGSFLANFFGENFLNPLIEGGPKAMVRHIKEQTKDDGFKGLFKDLYEHRKPEFLDVILHVDDFATGAAISGLSFVEPFLALLYAFSGDRAAIGYRNNGEQFSSKQLKLAKGHLSLLKDRLQSVPVFHQSNQNNLQAEATPTAQDNTSAPQGKSTQQQTQQPALNQRFVYFSA